MVSLLITATSVPKTDSCLLLLPFYLKKWWTKPVPMGGFRDCVHNLHLKDLEIQGFDLREQCVTIIEHAHTNRPQPASNKIQVRTSEECRCRKIFLNKKKSQEGLEAVYPCGKIVSLKAFRPTSSWSLQVVVTDSVKLRAESETQARMLHPRGLLCEMLGQQASEGGGNRPAELAREAQKVQVESCRTYYPWELMTLCRLRVIAAEATGD